MHRLLLFHKHIIYYWTTFSPFPETLKMNEVEESTPLEIKVHSLIKIIVIGIMNNNTVNDTVNNKNKEKKGTILLNINTYIDKTPQSYMKHLVSFEQPGIFLKNESINNLHSYTLLLSVRYSKLLTV